jgi:hypothetical protein
VEYVVTMNSRGCNAYVGAALRHGEKHAEGERAGKKHFCAASHSGPIAMTKVVMSARRIF